MIATTVYTQNTVGLPNMLHYTKLIYNGGLQNWDIKQGKNGLMYFANNEGLLCFDGVNWIAYPLPNKTIVRSLEISDDGKIYVGGQDELGYYEPNKQGILKYHDLVPSLPKGIQSFGDVWKICKLDQVVYCRTKLHIIKISHQNISSYQATKEWLYLGICNNKVYAQDKDQGLLVLDNGNWYTFINNANLPTNDEVTGVLYNNNSTIISIIKSGLFTYTAGKLITCKLNSIYQNDKIYSITNLDTNKIAIATTNNGIYIANTSGIIQQHFSTTQGLQNKNVLSVYLDKQKNIWLGLDNGIDLINYNGAIKEINPLLQNASGYASVIHNNTLYVGTTTGLYATPIEPIKDISQSKATFTQVNNANRQIWSLAVLNKQLLLGSHEGAYEVKNNIAYPIANNTGYWTYHILNNNNIPTLVAGNYNGISIFDIKLGKITLKKIIQNFTESSRYVVIDADNNIWVSHPYHGIYKLTQNSNEGYNTANYSTDKGLPSKLNNHIFKIKNKLVVATVQGIYTYNNTKDAFTNDNEYTKTIGNISIQYLKEDSAGNLWCISNKRIGVLNNSNPNTGIQYIPELTNKLLNGFEYIYPYNSENILVSGGTGMYHINYSKYTATTSTPPIIISNIHIYNTKDSILYNGSNFENNTLTNVTEIPASYKQIRFAYASPTYGITTLMNYSYQLKGYDKQWSEWSKRTEKDYTNLPAGTYTFMVKTKNNMGIESQVAQYEFIIKAPWYATTIAYIIYIIALAYIIYKIIKWQQKKFKVQQEAYQQEQQKLLYILELERNKKESEIIAIKNEQLEANINYQNSELAATAMHLVQKGELLTKLKTVVTHVQQNIENTATKNELKKIAKTLTAEDNMDKEWDNFAKHFDKVHTSFLAQLKTKHPTITPNELKLSAYLRMNLSTKEMAQLMNISVRGVEISRYRLRKKLGIESSMSLFDYLMTV